MDLHHYALRVDLTETFKILDDLEKWLDNIGHSYLVCKEDPNDNPHCHVYLSSELKLKGLQTSWRRSFPTLIGNGAYSLKECLEDYQGYLRYICKGDGEGCYPEVVLRQGLDFDDYKIVELHEDYWCSNRELLKHRKVQIDVKVKGSIVEQVELAAKRQKLDGTDREAIARIYVQMYVDMRKPCNVYHAKGVVNTVCATLSGHMFDQLVYTCAER